MTIPKIERPFKEPFLDQLVLVPTLLPFSDKEILELDVNLNQYEQLFLDLDIEKNLISKNELLASFAISKAENSTLTLQEAQSVYDFLLSNKEYTFISEKLKAKKKLDRKDYEKLEFFNIAKAFNNYKIHPIGIKDVTLEYIKELHKQLTQGLDIFKDYLTDFDVYKAGNWRDNDKIRVGTYIPAPHTKIEKGVGKLLAWIKKNPGVTSVGIFHTAFYAIHPFNNGNKRVSRVLEHIFLRSLGLNAKNLYSTSYYYHKEKPRYYKYLLSSLEKKNLNHFVEFFQEALVLSIISVIKTSIEFKRKEFLDRQEVGEGIKNILKPLIKRHEAQFKGLFRTVRGKLARQTFVNYLQQATDLGIVMRREKGRTTYYQLNVSSEEEKIFHDLLDFAKSKLSFVPDDIKLT